MYIYSKLTLARTLVGVNPVEDCECTNPPDESKASPSLWPEKKRNIMKLDLDTTYMYLLIVPIFFDICSIYSPI